MSDEILCLDSNVIIWGILKNGKTESEKQMIKKAISFLEQSFNEGKVFAISIISLSEFFVQIPDDKHNYYMDFISKHFIILPFGTDAALWASSIFKKYYGEMKSSYYNGSRGILRPDIQILASALAFGKIRLVTEDRKFQKLAEKYLSVSGIPDLPPVQDNLF